MAHSNELGGDVELIEAAAPRPVWKFFSKDVRARWVVGVLLVVFLVSLRLLTLSFPNDMGTAIGVSLSFAFFGALFAYDAMIQRKHGI